MANEEHSESEKSELKDSSVARVQLSESGNFHSPRLSIHYLEEPFQGQKCLSLIDFCFEQKKQASTGKCKV